jgi:predicted TIM-barrel fold metal-dependent hydrolase
MNSDTPPEVRQRQVAAILRLDTADRLAAAAEMSELARELRIAGLRLRHPDRTDAELRRQWIRETYGEAVLPPSAR